MSKDVEVAILFADVVGSTQLYERLGDVKARQMVGRCLDIMREATEANRGTVIKTIGDEVMCTFPSADDAMNAAKRMQERISVDGEPIDPEVLADAVVVRRVCVVPPGRQLGHGDLVGVGELRDEAKTCECLARTCCVQGGEALDPGREGEQQGQHASRHGLRSIGVPLQGIGIIMAVFLTISLSISAAMNAYNRRIALRGASR